MHQQHPEFDLVLEMLCCFGSRPVTRHDLAHDLGLRSGHEVRTLFVAAQMRFGVHFVAARSIRQRDRLSNLTTSGYLIAERHRLAIRGICQAYWRKVNGSGANGILR